MTNILAVVSLLGSITLANVRTRDKRPWLKLFLNDTYNPVYENYDGLVPSKTWRLTHIVTKIISRVEFCIYISISIES